MSRTGLFDFGEEQPELLLFERLVDFEQGVERGGIELVHAARVQDDGSKAGPLAAELVERALEKRHVAKIELGINAQDERVGAALRLGEAADVAVGFGAR